ncbi:twin-arginine translocation signal domain-containing protein [Streptomyces sp. NBC_00841]
MVLEMDTTRRMLLRGVAAAPLAAATGGLWVPSTAEAAPPRFRGSA